MKTALTRILKISASFTVGCLVGVVLHYALYRMGMPLKPFIYMSF
jgi:hypothetical protein